MKFTRTILFLLMFAFVSACNSTIPTPTEGPTNTPAPTATETPTPTPDATATSEPTKPPEPTVEPYDLSLKTCTPDDTPAILAAVQEKFKFSEVTPSGRMITNIETSPTYSGKMEVAFKCALKGKMKDPSGKQGDVSVDGLTLVVFHIKVAGQDAFLQLIYDSLGLRDIFNGNKLRVGRPGISYVSPNADMKRLQPQLVNLLYLEEYNGLSSKLSQFKPDAPLSKDIQFQPFEGVFFWD